MKMLLNCVIIRSHAEGKEAVKIKRVWAWRKMRIVKEVGVGLVIKE